jgi:hypothetical protein
MEKPMADKPEIIDADVTPVSRERQVATYEAPPARPPASPFDVPQQDFKAMVQQRGENYQHLVSWLIDHMVPGEDVVQVHVTKRDSCQYGGPPPRGSCGPTVCPGHWSDPDLSKKGAEKVTGLLGLGVRFLGMDDFRRAALKGIKLEHIICDCELYNERATLSQGTGACSMSEVYDNLNSAMKKAAKRAMVDAVKRCAGLSGLATELKRRMPPPDIEAAARAAEAAQHKGQRGGYDRAAGNGRYSTGAKLDTCPIGKQHKGKPWREIPTDYLEWMLRECADKPDVVKAAAAELSLRKSRGSSSTSTRPSPSRSDSPPADDWPPDFDDDIPY